MLSKIFLFYLLVIAMMLVFTAPAAEAAYYLVACLSRSELCLYPTTTPEPAG
ncbi:hypothetical protein KR093_004021 [Drosophila rubida]|uniref:Uncharacterized protein n=1 Tax=Drosophila rubida TaxID=30044 RepID=A0AAD4PFG1_9MUSC|nr:hypothetical protein KR093_004021 [Drosophila rubida]